MGAAQSTRLRGDELRLDGFLGYVDLRYRFYGSRRRAPGSDGTSVPIVQKGCAFAPELLFQVAQRTFVGLRYRGVRVETALDDAASLPPAIAAVLPSSITITSSGFGPRATFDTRDNDMNPAAGVLLDLRANFADEAFGSDFDYQTYEVSGEPLPARRPAASLALRGYACQASDRTPLFDLCLFGANNDLRGYEVGRYRDRAMVAAQAEYRFPLARALGRRGVRRLRQGGALVRRHGRGARPAEHRRRRALARCARKRASTSASTWRAAATPPACMFTSRNPSRRATHASC